MKTHVRRPRGTVLIAALVCLVIVMAVLGSMLTGTLRARRQLHAERDRRQAELLLQAGIERAKFKAAEDDAYRGETWQLPTEQVLGNGKGIVTITLSKAADDQSWQYQVVAEYPAGNPLSIRRSRTFASPQKTP
jgi:hypothetical protein